MTEVQTETFKLLLTFQNEVAVNHDKRENRVFENVVSWTVTSMEGDGYRVITVKLVDGDVYTFFENDQFELIKSAEHRKSPTINEVREEMYRQHSKWGQQNHASYTPQGLMEAPGPITAELAKLICDLKAKNDAVSWTDIFLEEVFEAFEEAKAGNLENLRTELVQVAAVAVSWVESIDRNQK